MKRTTSASAFRHWTRTQLIVALMAGMILLCGTAAAVPADLAPRGVGTADGIAVPGISGTWKWPVDPIPAVTAYFDPPPQPWASGHRGVDVTVTPGQPVMSPESGRVVFVGTVVDRRVVTIDHGGGILSSFEPASAVLAAGDTVSAGQVIATISSGGHCSTACLHWGVRLDGEYVNPLNFVTDRRPSVLLPLVG